MYMNEDFYVNTHQSERKKITKKPGIELYRDEAISGTTVRGLAAKEKGDGGFRTRDQSPSQLRPFEGERTSWFCYQT